ncbi:unnamed protein product [Miscanthus lutarioriparius]|uniref:Uncharacterized protein n=1 Tax=Miscanthus lutarioriparius TaxID=422564 RepID=A0A811PYD4_9POAL|nr:unnamed protein product [Miscanthus lutarioriparius]
MDLANGRDDALNGGVGVEETRRRRWKVELVQEAIHGFLEKGSDSQGEEKRLAARQEEQELLSSLLTKLGELENDTDSDILEPNSSHLDHEPAGKGEQSKEVVELAVIAKDLNKIKRQNMITHLLLGTVIVLTAVFPPLGAEQAEQPLQVPGGHDQGLTHQA